MQWSMLWDTLNCGLFSVSFNRHDRWNQNWNMAMLKDLIKPHSSKVLGLEHAVVHSMGYIKLSVFCLF